ncbi:DUF317 domain-containing protein [Streptomyces virginiae]|uniref:DUF317 domain-containing protein n=1 Tax=Streptomyces virginiae TaxID=1961 RepID=UPI0022572482|nr:DUF317 domain-containing protein [Streptomyces virginiae]MCX5274948.1 hypothetical protein [Streptomyces virginiae]
MAVSPAQRASYAEDHATKIPFETTPRPLAGPGDPRHVTHALLAAGWTLTSAPGDLRIALAGPDEARHQLVIDPFASGSPWRIQSVDWTWNASFDRMVPAEIIAGFTDGLLHGPRRGDSSPWEHMQKAGWAVERQPDGTGQARSPAPELPISAELRPIFNDSSDHMAWRIVQPDHIGAPIWKMWISGPVPEHLMAGLAEQLVSASPVLRGMYDLDHYSARQNPSPLTPQQAVEAHFTRIDATRAQARSQRRTHLTTRLPAPAAAPASPVHSRTSRP